MRRNQVANAIGEVRSILQEMRVRVHPKGEVEARNALSTVQCRALYDWADEIRRQARAWCEVASDLEPDELPLTGTYPDPETVGGTDPDAEHQPDTDDDDTARRIAATDAGYEVEAAADDDSPVRKPKAKAKT